MLFTNIFNNTDNQISFVVIIASILPQLQQAITYSPAMSSNSFINDEICFFSAMFGTVCISISKLAL